MLGKGRILFTDAARIGRHVCRHNDGKALFTYFIMGGVKLKLFNGIALLSLLFTIAIMTLPANEDKYCLVFIPIFLLNSINHKGFIHKIFDHKIFSYLGGMTFEMYLLHAPLLMICSHIFPKLIGDNKVILFVSYLIVILIMSLIFKRVCKLINARLFRNDKQS